MIPYPSERPRTLVHVRTGAAEDAERLRILADTATALLLNEEPRTIIDGLFERLADHLRLELYLNYLYDEERAKLRLHSWGGLTEGQAETIECLDLNGGIFATVSGIAGGRPEDGPLGAALGMLGISGYVCFPLIAHDRLIGTLSFGTRERREFDEGEIGLLKTVSDLVAMRLERSRLIGEAMRQADELKRTSESKDELMGVVSHELRGPLSIIRASAGIIRSQPGIDEQERDRMLANIEGQTQRLGDVIHQLLLLSRLQLGQTIETEPVLVHRVIQRVVSAFATVHPKRRITFEARQALPAGEGHEIFLEHILTNVLSNADQYSPLDEDIEVRARTSGAEIEVMVRDRGPGVPAPDLENIFQRFYRSKSASGRAAGEGLGLTVCRRLVEAMSGRIWARNAAGGGLEVVFTLPASSEEPDEVEQASD